MPIRLVSKPKEEIRYRVFCDTCGTGSNCAMEDPGDLSLKAKKERFVTIPGKFSFDPMTWACGSCNEQKTHI